MKSLSQRGVLVFGVVLVVGVLVPSLASAASWSPVGTTHQLFSSNLAVLAHTSPLGGAVGVLCAGAEADADVASANLIVITSSRFSGCTGTAGAASCTATPVGTGQWTATATSTSNIQMHNVTVDVLFEGASCAVNGAKVLVTGTLTGGSWATNEGVLTAAPGATVHYLGLGTSSSTTTSSTIRDTASTLKLFD